MAADGVKKVNRFYLGLVLIYLGGSALPVFLPGGGQRMPMIWILLLSQMLVLVPGLIWRTSVGRRMEKQYDSESCKPFFYSWRRIPLPAAGMLVLFTVLISPVATFLNAVSLLFEGNAAQEMLDGMQGVPLWGQFLLMAVLPAFTEEFVFRGIFYSIYRQRSVWKGALLSGMLFGLMHLNLNQMMYAVFLGFVFAMLVEATGSLLAPSICHLLFNGSSVLLSAAVERMLPAGEMEGAQSVLAGTQGRELLLSMIAVYGVIALVSAVLAVCAYIYIVKKCGRISHMREVLAGKRSTGETGEDESEEKKSRYLTPSLGVGAAICLVFILWLG